MRIAYFTESLYPLVDGVSRTLARLFDTLEEEGVDFRIYSPFTPDSSIRWSARVRRVRYIRFPLYPDYRVSIPFGHGLDAEMEEFSPDLVHVVSPTPMAAWAQRWARRHQTPVVASFHTHFVSYFRYYGVPRLEGWGWRMLRRFYARCDRVYAPTWSIIRELEAHQIANLELWSRGIDPESFSPAYRDEALRRELGADQATPIVLLVSRLVKEKDLADLVEMNRILAERGALFSFVLVGDGPMRRELETALPGAHFAGHRTGRDLARFYASGDVFVFPSTTETLGNVVLEALASGLAAVVVDRGGPQDLVADGETGFITRANDPKALADRVEALIRQPALRQQMGTSARRSALDRSWAAINGRLLRSYREVVG